MPISSTSKSAYLSLDLPKLELEFLMCLEGLGPMGGTNDEISDALGIDRQSVTPRAAPLIRKGLVFISGKRKGRSGYLQQVKVASCYSPTPIVVSPPTTVKTVAERIREARYEGMKIIAKEVLKKSDLREAKLEIREILLKEAMTP